MTTDAIVMLKDDHQEIRGLFRDLQAAGENATATKGKLATRMIELRKTAPHSPAQPSSLKKVVDAVIS